MIILIKIVRKIEVDLNLKKIEVDQNLYKKKIKFKTKNFRVITFKLIIHYYKMKIITKMKWKFK